MVSEIEISNLKDKFFSVLILVLVEDGLREAKAILLTNFLNRLNPCSCGGWSQSSDNIILGGSSWGLNPCSCGGWSQRSCLKDELFSYSRGLNPCSCGGWSQRRMVKLNRS